MRSSHPQVHHAVRYPRCGALYIAPIFTWVHCCSSNLPNLHPLWWTPILPIMFFISAISVGLAMIIFESSLSSRYFKRGLEIHLLAKLAKAIPVVCPFTSCSSSENWQWQANSDFSSPAVP